MSKQPVLEDIAGLLCLYGALIDTRREHGLSTHHTRVLLAIYYLQQANLKGITRKAVARHTYLWLSVVKAAVNHLVGHGYIKPVTGPKYYLQFTEQGLAIISEITKDCKKRKRVLTDGPVILNRSRSF